MWVRSGIARVVCVEPRVVVEGGKKKLSESRNLRNKVAEPTLTQLFPHQQTGARDPAAKGENQ